MCLYRFKGLIMGLCAHERPDKETLVLAKIVTDAHTKVSDVIKLTQ